ncbi:MAG: hypothetical protein Q9167_003462 [Letrouitia subvulpina]
MNPQAATASSVDWVSQYDLSNENISNASDQLKKLLGQGKVVSDLDVRRAHSITKWSAAAPSQIPALVVFPDNTTDVAVIMRVCSSNRIPVVGYCGGTSLPGAITATQTGVSVDFNRMNKILATHADDMDVVLQPAVGWEELNDHLKAHDLFFPPDPGPGAKIGTNAYRYGAMRQWVISMTVVLANGTVIKTRQRPRKSSAGYDLTNLMVGSEGTLGLVTEAVLKVTPIPQNLHVAIASFPTEHAATSAAMTLIRSGLSIDAVELLDKHGMWAINQSGLSSRKWIESPTLFLKVSGLPSVIQTLSETIREAAERNQCESFDISAREKDIDIWWGARKQVLPSLLAMKKHDTDLHLGEDTAVPISRLADIMKETHEAIESAGLTGSVLGHVGDGNFHTSIVCPEDRKDDGERVISWLRKRAIELEGTVTGEHGIGLKLKDSLVDELGKEAVDTMRKVSA